MREMKDSGIEWIGAIPINWDIAQFKKILIRNDGGLWGNDPSGQDDILVLRSTEQTIDGKWDIQSPAYRDLSNVSNVQEYLVKCGDLLITKSSGSDLHIGKTTIVDELIESLHCSFSNFIQRLRVCSKMNPRYYWYILNSSIARGQFVYLQNSTSGIGNINSKNINEIEVPIPPLDIQHTIVDYLDRKCSQIDIIIARQQEVIEKLKAYKLSIITEAVTKGLNPDVPMKDSGVEWIGEIPKHWKMVRLKFLLSHIIDCPHETPIYSADGGHLVIRTADQDLGKLRTDEDMYRLDEGEYQSRIRRMSLEKDDIVYGREGERWGLACLVPESNKYCLGQRMLQFRCKNELFLPSFAMWALNSKFVYLQGAVDTIGSTSPHVNISTVRNFLIPVPNIDEQQEIVEYVDKKMLQLDKEVEHREMLICKLNEYKKSLIYEVVTGKKEV